MANMYKILSTLGAAVNFEVIAKDAQGNNITQRKISIPGGNGVFDQKYNIMRSAQAVWVSEDELEELNKLPNFTRMVKRGHLIVIGDQRKAQKVDIEEVAEDMNPKDGSAQWSKDYMPTASPEVKNLDLLDRKGNPILKSNIPESRVIDAKLEDRVATKTRRGKAQKKR